MEVCMQDTMVSTQSGWHADRPSDRQTDKQTDRQADRQAGKKWASQTGRQAYVWERWITDLQSDRSQCRQASKQAFKWVGRHVNMKAGIKEAAVSRQVDRQADM